MKNCLFIFLLLILCPFSHAQKTLRPKWINQQVIVADKCDFILVHLDGESNIRDARTASMADLRIQLEHTDLISVDQIYTSKSHDEFSSKDGITSKTTKQEDEGWIEIKVDGIATPITSRRIGEYWNPLKQKNEYYALFAIPEEGSNVCLSCLTETTSYSNEPMTWGLSLIPGAAQMHKGSYVKGGIIMAGSVALAGGIIAFENMRSEYMSKITQTHNGYLVTSNKSGYEGASIFLPAAGYRDGSEFCRVGSFGDYWSNSLNTVETTDPYFAYGLGMISGSRGPVGGSRYCGYTVRPVCP